MMRCFLPCCFRCSSSSSKRRNHFHSSVNAAEEGALEVKAAAAILVQPTHQIAAVQESIDWIVQSKIQKEEEEESYNKAQVKSTDEVTKSIEETEEVEKRASESERDKHEEEGEECSESLFSLSLGSAGKAISAAEPEVNSPMQQLQQHQVEGEASEKEEKVEATPMNHLVPKEYRYRDLLHSESEKKKRGKEEKEYSYTYSSSESLFSLSTDGYRKRNSSAENEKEEVSSTIAESNIPEVSSVLKPIENVSEVKVVEPSLNSKDEEKENINLVDVVSNCSLKKMKKEMRLDSSFSSWLVESEESTPAAPTTYSHEEDRPILGALTGEVINVYSSTASSRNSRRRSPNTPRIWY